MSKWYRERWLQQCVQAGLGGFAIGGAALFLSASIGAAAQHAPHPKPRALHSADDGAAKLAEPPPGLAASPQAVASTRRTPAGPAVVGGHTKPVRVADYRLQVELDPQSHRIDGQGELRWTNRSHRPQREIYLHLYLNAFRDRRSNFNRSTAGAGFRGSPVVTGRGYTDVSSFVFEGKDLWPKRRWATEDNPEDRTDVRLELPRSIAPDETVRFQFHWKARLPALRLRTGYVDRFHMVAQWFPKIARLERDGSWAHFPFERLSEFYADFGDYDVSIRVPEGFTVAASGVRKRTADKKGKRRIRYVAKGVHDFAFCAWDAFKELRRTTRSGIQLRALFPPGEEGLARRELRTAERGLAHFSSRYGSYPYANLTLVRPPQKAREAGAMEYPTLITTGATGRYRWFGSRRVEGLVLHELAHQWFYGLLASNEHRFAFLDEGLATYAQMEAAESFWPKASLASWLGFRLGLPGVLRTAAARAQHHGPIARSVAEFSSGSDYGRLVYSRMATALLSAGRLWGQSRLQAALRDYSLKHRFSHPGPEDLLESISAQMGTDAEKFMRSIVLEGAFVDISVEDFGYQKGQGGAGGRATNEQTSVTARARGRCFVVLHRAGSLVVPVEVDVQLEDGSKKKLSWQSRDEHGTLRFACASEIAAVVVDPGLRLAIDGDLRNNVKRRQPRHVNRAWLARLQALGHVLQWLVSP